MAKYSGMTDSQLADLPPPFIFGSCRNSTMPTKRSWQSGSARRSGTRPLRASGEAAAIARERGARLLYVSATPTENTVNFYLRRGCILATPPDPELLALEPDDIHLVFSL